MLTFVLATRTKKKSSLVVKEFIIEALYSLNVTENME